MNRLFFVVCCVMSSVLMFVSAGQAQQADATPQSTPKTPEMSKEQQALEHLLEQGAKLAPTPLPEPKGSQDEPARAAYAKAYYEALIKEVDHRVQVFYWQLFSTKIIFFTVLLLVFIGMVFSGMQFYKSIKYVPKPGEHPPDSPVTEFEASTSGIKVSSPVLGIVILVISLAFFYLYLVHVYPIEELGAVITK